MDITISCRSPSPFLSIALPLLWRKCLITVVLPDPGGPTSTTCLRDDRTRSSSTSTRTWLWSKGRWDYRAVGEGCVQPTVCGVSTNTLPKRSTAGDGCSGTLQKLMFCNYQYSICLQASTYAHTHTYVHTHTHTHTPRLPDIPLPRLIHVVIKDRVLWVIIRHTGVRDQITNTVHKQHSNWNLSSVASLLHIPICCEQLNSMHAQNFKLIGIQTRKEEWKVIKLGTCPPIGECSEELWEPLLLPLFRQDTSIAPDHTKQQQPLHMNLAEHLCSLCIHLEERIESPSRSNQHSNHYCMPYTQTTWMSCG